MPRLLDRARFAEQAGSGLTQTPSKRASRCGAAGLAPGWHYQLLRSAEQALDDVARSESASVVLLKHPRLAEASEYLDDLEARAAASGFVTVQVKVLAECAFDSFEGLVQASLRGLRAPAAPRARRGLVSLLDAFIASRGKDATRELDAQLEAEGLMGDLTSLARAYLGAGNARRMEAARIEAWLSGVELARAATVDSSASTGIAALSARTAKRVLAELTRLVRVLGWRGTLLMFYGADVIANLPPSRREAAYTVLRELVDNADGGRGLVATEIVIAASTSFFTGPRSLASLPPLALRVDTVSEMPAGVPPPHRPLVDLSPADAGSRAELPPLRPAPDSARQELRAIVRAAHGLPPLEAASAMSIGAERIDRAIDALFEHSRADGSVFALLTGAYGTGKTHFLLHLAARALADRRPVLRLSLERLDMDLGHPERHVARMLEQASLPGINTMGAHAGRTLGPLDRLLAWTRAPNGLEELTFALEAIHAQGGEAAEAAERALSIAASARRPGAALESHLAATDLTIRAPSVGARRDAYGRLLLWLALLERIEGCAGPVLIIDEAENLYRGAATRPERRTALRSLSFYCGGALPRTCVVLAITPEALVQLQEEAPLLLQDVAEQRTLLPWEDPSMLCRRLARTRPLLVPALGREHRAALANHVRATHAAVRGDVRDPSWDTYVMHLVGQSVSPREIVRRAIDRLERAWWVGPAHG